MARRNRGDYPDPLERVSTVMPGSPIYEVRTGGYTVEWTDSLPEALAAWLATRRADREVWRMVNGEKALIDIRAAATHGPQEVAR